VNSNGWHALAHRSALDAQLVSIKAGRHRVLLLHANNKLRAFDAVCPHRGADLGHGTLEGADTVRCGLHGFRIGLGKDTRRSQCVSELPCMLLGDLVFVRLGQGPDCGFAAAALRLAHSHDVTGPVSLHIAVDHRMVIENAFDELHFVPVHSVTRLARFEVEHDAEGALSVTSRFTVPPSRWQRPRLGQVNVEVPFRATAYSSGVVVTRMGGMRPYVVITAARPMEPGSCQVDLCIATPKGVEPHDSDDLQYLLQQGAAGLELDRKFWESMLTSVCNLTSAERAVQAFRHFCAAFDDGAASAP